MSSNGFQPYSTQIQEFQDHKAKIREIDGITELVWKKPRTGINQLVYLIRRNRLFVAGDLGGAVYTWSSEISLPFLNDCSLSYFHEKCEASEKGNSYEYWNSHKAEKRIKEFPEEFGEDFKKELFAELRETMIGAAYSQEQWTAWLGTDEAYDLIGDEYSEYANIGIDIHPRCVYHWLGLQMAYEQIMTNNPEFFHKVIEAEVKEEAPREQN